jgi:hypothetical protein
MHPLSRLAGRAVDRVMGLPSAPVPYVMRPDVAVRMPDGVVLLVYRRWPAPGSTSTSGRRPRP